MIISQYKKTPCNAYSTMPHHVSIRTAMNASTLLVLSSFSYSLLWFSNPLFSSPQFQNFAIKRTVNPRVFFTQQQRQPSLVSSFRIYSCSSFDCPHHPNTKKLALFLSSIHPFIRFPIFSSQDFFVSVPKETPRNQETPRQGRNWTHQIQSPPDKMISHTRTILTPAASNQHNTVLLNIMTFSRNICRDDPARTQSHPCGLALCGIGLLGLRDSDLQTDAFERRRPDLMESGRHGFARALSYAAALRRKGVSKGMGYGVCGVCWLGLGEGGALSLRQMEKKGEGDADKDSRTLRTWL